MTAEANSALAALSILVDGKQFLHYFSLTWHETKGWECHLRLAYSGTQYVDKYGQHIVDIYAFATDKTDPLEAVLKAQQLLNDRAQAAVDSRNERPAPKTIAGLIHGSTDERSADDILKELGL